MYNNVYNGILEVKDYFDVFIFDAYGVFWDGSDFYKNSRESMAKLIKEDGKIIYILSNTTQTSKEAEESYDKKGLKKGIHYNEIITSGEITKDFLTNNEELKKRGLNIWQYGRPIDSMFEGTGYINVNNIDEANYIYISVPQFSEDKINELKKEFGKDIFVESLHKTKDGKRLWDTTNKDVFVEDVEFLASKNLPVIIANPDEVANEADKTTGKKYFVIRQGTIGNMLKEKGIEVIEFGKPDIAAYNFVFNKLREQNIDIDKDRIAMVGDTLRTDVLGANNAKIKSILCVDTGVTNNNAMKIVNKEKSVDLIDAIKKLEKENNVTVNYYINSVGGIE